jgi:hypothetical protein
MTRKDPPNAGLSELNEALDTYGADRTRWPAPLRHSLSSLVATNPEAEERLRRGEVFDRLLDKAPGYDATKLKQLAERIASATQTARVAAFVSPRKSFSRREYSFAGAALAASLLLGVIVGQSPFADRTLADADGATISTQMAQTDYSDSLLDEDLL